ncbi:hypothetical protein [Wenxinia marina]|uniref:Uncharacterized protein n=1 Tax=Wenxinia marina DSM 24838 TaxID=1123501 RepID=A0A0D0NSV9_9RHOB|nr:hypothetical protein [Wenxinia marina]KIQ71265.1 hypothetical protein Wenmar_00033 [Wenxinia marina DSM 24838]GGL73361.1 hypothetical protein GCM10011392_29890 [Wenxinia marina]
MRVSCLALLLGALAPLPASALSCLPPNPTRTYGTADAAEESYVVLLGTLSFDAAWPDRLVMTDGPPDETFRTEGRFEGMSLAADGFTTPYASAVEVVEECAGPWCGQLSSGAEVLAFARVGEDGVPQILADPCGFWTFVAPTEEQVAAVTACAGRDTCAVE